MWTGLTNWLKRSEWFRLVLWTETKHLFKRSESFRPFLWTELIEKIWIIQTSFMNWINWFIDKIQSVHKLGIVISLMNSRFPAYNELKWKKLQCSVLLKSVINWNDVNFYFCKLFHVQQTPVNLWEGDQDKDEEKEQNVKLFTIKSSILLV